MIISKPHAGLLSDSMAAVISSLASMTPGRSGRAIATSCPGISVAQVNIVLRRLESLGIVRTESVPPAKRYFWNEDHILAQPLVSLTGADKKLPSILRKLYSEVSGLDSVILFGSVARSEDTAQSDVDVLLVFDYESDDQIDYTGLFELSLRFQKLTGNELNFIAKMKSEVTPIFIESSGFLQNVMAEGQVIIGGLLGTQTERPHNEGSSPTINSHRS